MTFVAWFFLWLSGFTLGWICRTRAYQRHWDAYLAAEEAARAEEESYIVKKAYAAATEWHSEWWHKMTAPMEN